MEYNNQKNYYSKNNLWRWILIYIVIGIIAYGLIYYFFIAKNGGYSYNSQQYQTQNDYLQAMPIINNSQDLISASQILDATDINQIDTELNQNDADANAF